MLWYHLVRRSVVLLLRCHRPPPISHRRKQVASDSPGSLPGCGERHRHRLLQGQAGENGQPGCCLCKSSLQETVGYAGGKLPAGVANDWVTCRSPVACLADSKVNTHGSSFAPPRGDLPSEGGACRIACMRGGSMYSLACRTPGIIPREYCSLRDRGA